MSPNALERFRVLIPTLRRVLVPYDAQASYLAEPLRALRLEASRLGIRLDEWAVRTQVVSETMRFVINLRTAQQLGLTIPPGVLSQVDEIIR